MEREHLVELKLRVTGLHNNQVVYSKPVVAYKGLHACVDWALRKGATVVRVTLVSE